MKGYMVSSLDDLIPDESVAEEYVGRELHGGHRDLEILDWARMFEHNVLIKGPTGPGKTMLCEAYCASRQIPFVHINPGTAVEPAMIMGKEVLRKGSTYWLDGILTAAMRRGDCVVLFDEINLWPPGVTGMLHSTTDRQRYIYLLDRIIEVEDADGVLHAMPEIVRAAEGILFIAAYNPRYEGTFRPNAAFENRFAVQFRWDYSTAVEDALVSLPSLKQIAKRLREMHASGEISVPVSTNKLMFFQQIADDLGLSAAIDNFIAYFEGTEHESVRNVFKLNRTRLENEVKAETGRDADQGRFVK
jgi:MoxR-like ATPase